jgi:DNA-binding transcriptional ArsR family regulator
MMTEQQIALMRDKRYGVAAMLRDVSHPDRLMILCLLSQDELTVNALEKALNIEQSRVSQHLMRLRRGKYVKVRRVGRMAYYSIADERLLHLLQKLHMLYCTT